MLSNAMNSSLLLRRQLLLRQVTTQCSQGSRTMPTCSPNNQSGFVEEMVGPTISASVGWTTFLLKVKTSTFLFLIQRCIPIQEVKFLKPASSQVL